MYNAKVIQVYQSIGIQVVERSIAVYDTESYLQTLNNGTKIKLK